ncbi:cytochrome P450 714B3-like isoform X2 [Phoenix dactylifera]|uniref:Cytochrome P450 714B3-like isoform X2 n=1 Tax=Phoenix dactylifera TaxID=42345 RepID=A0A8B9A1C2_PHODC|nr:cytochrome P450 714B3-like isoform X2 [Phoenix dactylifera]
MTTRRKCSHILSNGERNMVPLNRTGSVRKPNSWSGPTPGEEAILSGCKKDAHLLHVVSLGDLFYSKLEVKDTNGPIFSYSMGNVVALHVSHPDLVKDITLCGSLALGKATYLKKTHEPLFGQGILKSNGEAWAYQRKIIAPEFFLEKVKGMVDLMVDCTFPLLNSWESKIERGKGIADIKVDEDLRSYSADVISRACFGSSYIKGKEIFLKLRVLQKAICKPNMFVEITGVRHIPTKRNREMWRLNKEIRSLILQVVKEGKGGDKNLLQAILRSASNGRIGPNTTDSFVVDNCKTIYFAGHETTAVTATWCLMLLGLHPEWQARARAEVAEVCDGRPTDARSLQKMKILTMVIQEALRLYPPGAYVTRETLQEMEFGGIHIPKGVNVYVPVSILHHDPNIWGPDVHEFNPERFASGVHGACQHPHMYVPFGAGTRTCLGQNFAMVELKIILSLVLSKFSFTLSPSYQHSPTLRLIVEPEFGVSLIMEKV